MTPYCMNNQNSPERTHPFPPPYSLDLTLSNYYPFKSLQNLLDDLRLTSNQEVNDKLVYYFRSQPKEFYTHTIKKLVIRKGRSLKTIVTIFMIKQVSINYFVTA